MFNLIILILFYVENIRFLDLRLTHKTNKTSRPVYALQKLITSLRESNFIIDTISYTGLAFKVN